MGLITEQRDGWRLGAAMGLAAGETHTKGQRGTFQNINSLDPEELFAAVMLGRYPKDEPEDRLRILVDHAEWGIRELWRQQEKGVLNFAALASKRQT
ncbi:Hypothetical protein AA314_07051 [Archangium gephyra]|nr:Hypothetical protein AA314_07051 [Archangium gephyra]